MTKILIPRSDSISAKTIVPTDFEKYFENITRDHVVGGFTVTASSGTNRSVDVASGTLRLKGMFVSNSANETTAYTFSTDNTHYLYVQLTRDGNNEPESWGYTSNTTGTVPTDSIMIAKVITSGGDVSSVDQSTEFKKTSHLHTFVGTGAEINALSPTFEGQLVFCVKSGNGFGKNVIYVRNGDNTAWNTLNINQLIYVIPSTTIGDYTTPVDSTASSSSGGTANISVLLVGGGGGGGTGVGNGAGGGGGGGFYSFNDPVSITSYAVTVGAGGAAGAIGGANGSNGEQSSFNSKIAYGGGGGVSGSAGAGGAAGSSNSASPTLGGAGGGGSDGDAGAGGAGLSSSISGSSVYYVGGGGGGTDNSGYAGNGGAAGNGGGGGGGGYVTGNGGSGTANTGGGGGGGWYSGGNGGSGIVIIRYLTAKCTATGGTITTDGSYKVHTFTSSGTFQVTAVETDDNIFDQNTATDWVSSSEANPNIYVDIGSDQEIIGIALNLNRTSTTINSFKIRASTGTSFNDSDNIAYLDVSDCTDDTWRYIAFNLSTTNKRYIQFYGIGTGVFAINEVKIRYGVSDLIKLMKHAHGTRDVSASSSFADTN